MIKLHSERNIKFSEFRKLFSNFQKYNNSLLLSSLHQKYPKKTITLTNYGRSAFQLILDQHNIKNCKVMIPAFICAIFDPIFKENNIEPILLDVEQKTFNLSPKTIEAGFDSEAKCLITNNMNGLPCPVDKIKKISEQSNIFLLEDCAHAFGAAHKGKSLGLYGDAAFLSFYKNLPTLAGGFALTTRSVSNLYAEKISWRSLVKLAYFLGNNANHYKQFKSDKGLYDEMPQFEEVIPKKPDRLVEALAAYYTKNLEGIVQKRQNIGRTWSKQLKNSGLASQEDNDQEHIYTYFSFLLPEELSNKRLALLDSLREKGIIGRIVWNAPLNKLKNDICPISKEISERIMGLPINANYSKKQINFAAETLLECLAEI